MKQIKLYNVIFPIWLIWLMPPVIFIAMAGNFVIDSGVLILSLVFLKATEITGYTVKDLYKRTILKVWIIGFLADILGTIPLIAGSILVGIMQLNIPYEIEMAVAMNPFTNIWAFLVVLSCMVLASIFIYFLNYSISFKNVLKDEGLKARLSIILAITTTPWTLLIPSEWLYRGF